MFYNSSLLGVWVWSRDSIAPPTVNPHIMHTHKFKKFGTMSHDQMHKNIGGQNPPSGSWPFWFLLPFLAISMPGTLTNSSYRFYTTHFTFSQYHPQALKITSYQELSPPSDLVDVVARSTLTLCHKAGSPYNFSRKISHLHQIAQLEQRMFRTWICLCINTVSYP